MSTTENLQELYTRCTTAIERDEKGRLILTTDDFCEFTSVLTTLPASQIVIEKDGDTPVNILLDSSTLTIVGKYNTSWFISDKDTVEFIKSDLSFFATAKENSDNLLIEINITNAEYSQTPVTVKYQKPKNINPNHVKGDSDKPVDTTYWFLIIPDYYCKDELGILDVTSLTYQDENIMSMFPSDSFFEALTLKQLFIKIDPTGQILSSLFGLGCTLNTANVDVKLFAIYSTAVDGGWDFKGSTGTGQEIPIDDLISDFVDLFGVDEGCIPTPISSLVIESIDVEFNTATEEFIFTLESKFALTNEPDAQTIDIVVYIHLQKTNDENGSEIYEINFTGKITISILIFSITFDEDDTMTLLMGSYTHTEDKRKINLKNIVTQISTDLATLVPANLKIDLKDVVLLWYEPVSAGQQATSSTFLLGFDLDIDLDITSNIPLVGKSNLSTDETVGIQNLQVIISSGAIAKNTIISLNTMLQKQGVHTLPDQGDLTGYVNLSAVLKLGSSPKPLSLPIGEPMATTANYPPITNQDGTPVVPSGSSGYSDGVVWITIQQILGPVNFQRIGVSYEDNILSIYLSAAITESGLSLSMDGLSIGTSLDNFDPVFSIHGIGIDYTNGPVEIGGSLLYSSTDYGDEFDGLATIDIEPLMLSAVGSYIDPTENNSDNINNLMASMFIYAVLGVPLGGTPFFFVNGLAAGFGYNRNLKLPSIYDVNEFPLVATAMDVAAGNTNTNLTQELKLMDDYISPSLGEYFGAAGIKFTSFKLLDSFALLVLEFGDRFEIDILGMSSLIIPPESEKTPLAQIQMNLEARIAPQDGVFSVEAVLTQGSYILSRNCHLTGGFAFYLWFSGEYSGDFVVTMGGYNPYYKVPAHYPQVPSLGFNWQVDHNLSLKGDTYFALTPCALMAGGHLQATWNCGPITAWFTAGADFIISWKPYYYNTHFHIDVGASYTFNLFGSQTITIDVGADIQLWGPEFSGKATVDIYIISFTISFGDTTEPTLPPLKWDDFKSTFLPDEDSICSVSVTGGLICQNTDQINDPDVMNDLGVMNAKTFRLETNSIIPTKNTLFGETSSVMDQQNFGIAPMNINADNFSTTHKVIIQRNNNDDWDSRETDFKIEKIIKKSPTALWGTTMVPDIKGNQFIENTLAGFSITPANEPTCGETKIISSTDLTYEDYDNFLQVNSFWGDIIEYDSTQVAVADINTKPESLTQRAVIMNAVNKNETLDNSLDLQGQLYTNLLNVVLVK